MYEVGIKVRVLAFCGVQVSLKVKLCVSMLVYSEVEKNCKYLFQMNIMRVQAFL